MIKQNQFLTVILVLAALACAVLLPACGLTVEAGFSGRTRDGQDWHVGIKSPPISLPLPEKKPDLPAETGPAVDPDKNPILPPL